MTTLRVGYLTEDQFLTILKSKLETTLDGSFQPPDPTLDALAALTWTAGAQIGVFTAADTVELRTIGAASATDIIDRDAGDGRYVLSTSYTAADVLAKLLTVDGSGSGLDADTLDGVNIGTSGNAIPKCNTANTFTGNQRFDDQVSIGGAPTGAYKFTVTGTDLMLRVNSTASTVASPQFNLRYADGIVTVSSIFTSTSTGFAFGTFTAHDVFLYRGNALKATLTASAFNLASGVNYQINGTQVLGPRRTGWAAASGTATRSTFDTATVTTAQLAERVKALIDDLIASGPIGA